MTDFTGIVRVVVFSSNHVQRMPKSTDVDELEVEGEKDGSRKQPDQDERHRHARERNLKENDFHDRVGQGLHDRIDLLING